MSSSSSSYQYASITSDETKQLVIDGLEKGKAFAEEQLNAIQHLADKEGYTWKVLGLFSGAFLVLNGFFGLLSSLTSLSPLMFVLNIYVILFGILSILLEYKRSATMVSRYVEIIKREAHFLYHPFGRGGFYIFCGLLLSVKGGIIDMVSGLGVLSVGVILILSTKEGYDKLQQMKAEQFDDQKIATVFQECDTNHDGALDASELAVVCQKLGSPLSYNVLESAILLLDKNNDGKIQYEEFVAWFKGNDAIFSI